MTRPRDHARGVVVRRFGGPEVLELAEVPQPRLQERQVRVRVVAAAVTPVDIDIRSGALAGALAARPYYALGRTAAGRIEEVGRGVDGYDVGDTVIGVCGPLSAAFAAQSETVVFDEDSIALAPRNVSPAESSALPLNGLTADQAVRALGLPAGARILITGAAGSVGGLAVQLAAASGLRVVAMARPSDEPSIRALGAEHFLPSTADVATATRDWDSDGVDGVIDAAALGATSAHAVRDGGSVVALVIGGEPPAERGLRISTVWARPDAGRLAQLVTMVEDGALVVRPAKTFPLARVADAHVELARGNVRRQLVLVP